MWLNKSSKMEQLELTVSGKDRQTCFSKSR